MTKSSTVTRKRRLTTEKLSIKWFKQAAFLIKTITDLHESPTGHGLGWTKGMIKHYAKNYFALRKKTPRKCIDKAGEYDTTVNTIIEHYETIG